MGGRQAFAGPLITAARLPPQEIGAHSDRGRPSPALPVGCAAGLLLTPVLLSLGSALAKPRRKPWSPRGAPNGSAGMPEAPWWT